MSSFSYLEPVYCSMSSYKCCFLTCIQISQEAGQVVWYSHLFKNFPVCCGPHSQRLSHSQWIRNRCFFWNSLDFTMTQRMLAILSLVPLPFLNPAWTSGSSQLVYCWSLAWRILSITLLACEMSTIWWSFQNSLVLPFFGIGMKTDLFQSCGHCWVFQICWRTECSTFTALSFRINSTAIPSPPLALFSDAS